MTVTLDINVLLDVFQQRQPHFPEITRNTNDFGSSPVRAISPADFLAMLAAT